MKFLERKIDYFYGSNQESLQWKIINNQSRHNLQNLTQFKGRGESTNLLSMTFKHMVKLIRQIDELEPSSCPFRSLPGAINTF